MFTVSLTNILLETMYKHLFPGDGKEAVIIALCGRSSYGDVKKMLFHKLIPIPYEECEIRTSGFVKWSTTILNPYLTEALNKGWGIIKIHSHPTGYRKFSETDNHSDKVLFSSIYGWMNNDNPHGSMIMLPDKKLFGRIITPNNTFKAIDKISIIGDDLTFNFSTEFNGLTDRFNLRTVQALGSGTTNTLKRLTIGVVGCSGTGSPVIEQLVRLGLGNIVLVDPDVVEMKNLNRILNTSVSDVKQKKYKVRVLEDAIKEIGIGTNVTVFSTNIYNDKEAIGCLSTCDIIFGCVDSIDGRFLLNQLASVYLIPYFDLGVKILADGKGGINQICGTVHYLKPGGSSLMSRQVYSAEEIRAAGIFRTNKNEFKKLKRSGYIVNVNVDSPAVISINMQIASIAVNEFLARIHPFRYDPSENFATTRFSISDGYFQYEKEGIPDEYLKKLTGRGDMKPLLNMPELS